MAKADRKAGWALWLQWVAATSLGLVVGFLAATILVEQLMGLVVRESFGDDQLIGIPITGATFAAVLGVVLGLFQWMVLRRHLPRMAWWAPVTTVGVALSFLFVAWVVRLWPVPSGLEGGFTWAEALVFVWGWAVVGAALGLPTGLAQAFVLQRHLPRAGRWVLTTVTAWAALAVTDATVFFILGGAQPLSGPLKAALQLLGAFLLIVGPGAITGVVLVWMLRRPRLQKAQP